MAGLGRGVGGDGTGDGKRLELHTHIPGEKFPVVG